MQDFMPLSVRALTFTWRLCAFPFRVFSSPHMFVGLGEGEVRGGEGGQASGGDFQVDDGGLEVAGFQQGCSDFVVRPGGVGLQFNRLVQMFSGLGVSRLPG